MLPPKLRAAIRDLIAPGEERDALSVTVYSFGFKHGSPLDADLVMDVRFLPNPYYDPDLRALTGLDAPCARFPCCTVRRRRSSRRSGARCSTSSCPATWPRASSNSPSPWDARAASTAAWRWPSSTADYLKAKGYRVSIAHRDLALAERADGSLAAAPAAPASGSRG